MKPHSPTSSRCTSPDARQQAAHFLEHEQAFRLGELPTEQPHPTTAGLAQILTDDTVAGIATLQKVDRDIAPVFEETLAGGAFAELCASMADALVKGRRVYFTGCGATGRLAILLEACWRRYWAGVEHPVAARIADQVRSVMAGGDFALIRSVEGFEDFADFGRFQLREAGATAGDVVVAITEGGETSFVIGTAWEALDIDARSFFVFNNPADILRRKVERSREVIDEPRITKLDLTTGPMAVAGSTRMQATTVELLVVGLALEAALLPVLKAHSLDHTSSSTADPSQTPADTLRGLLNALGTPDNLSALRGLVEHEAGIYRQGGLVTYFADAYLLDIMTDTTERSPTFSLPPFRESSDTDSARSWSFVKHPLHASEAAWRDMLGRPPQGLEWGAQAYARMNASEALCSDPPHLSDKRILNFAIGNERDPSRTDAPASLGVSLLVGDEVQTHTGLTSKFRCAVLEHVADYDQHVLLTIGSSPPPNSAAGKVYAVTCDLPESSLNLWQHVAAKLVLNTISTASMGLIGRLKGNWMVYVKTSNKKLIDRGVRLVADQAGVSYDEACYALFATLSDPVATEAMGRKAESPVAQTIARLQAAFA